MARNTVALGVRPPSVGGEGGAAYNPLTPVQMLEGFSRIQNMQNQNMLFQQEFAAKRRLGEIMSTAPDAATGYNLALQDPIAAPFAPAAFSAFRTGMLAMRQYNESLGRDARTALEAVQKASPQAFFDPDGYQNTMKAIFSTIPKDAQELSAPAFNYVQQSIFGGTEGMNAQDRAAKIQKNVIALGIGTGAIDIDKVHAFWGAPAPGETSLPDPYGGADIPGVRRVDPMTGGVTFQPYAPLPGPIPAPAGTSTPALDPALTPAPTTAPGPQSAASPPDTEVGQPTQIAGGEDTVLPSPGDYSASTSAVQPAADTSGAGPSQLVTPAQAAAAGRGAASVPGGVTQRGVTAQVVGERPYAHGMTFQQEQDIRAGTEQAKGISEEIDGDATALPGIANRLNALQDAVREFQAGGFATTRGNLANWAQGIGLALGIRPDIVDQWSKNIDSGNMDKQQVFRALVQQYAVNELKNVAQGTGRVMRSEVEAFMNSISENTDPRAIEHLLNTQGRTILMRNADRINRFIPYRNAVEAGQLQGYKPQDFIKWHATTFGPKDYPTTFAGIPIGPRDPMEAKGVPEMSGPGHYYHPETNSFSPYPSTPASPSTVTSP